ncbi:hypothetical protein Tsubulata_021471 [Turnera subulata]|uniref:DUF4283 domain-containing protein n=1 Tax=Turnera subulata TaxID=218843 RepID=A0A9Q0JBA9_9ROSI|nr:hypothetical protein Tsubulata_021471 [Turnera subulata]
MGGNQALLSFQSPEEMTSALRSHQDLLSNYFSRIKPSSPHDVSRERISWITCYGVPLHVWSSNIFSAFGNLLGKLLGVDEIAIPTMYRLLAKNLHCRQTPPHPAHLISRLTWPTRMT